MTESRLILLGYLAIFGLNLSLQPPPNPPTHTNPAINATTPTHPVTSSFFASNIASHDVSIFPFPLHRPFALVLVLDAARPWETSTARNRRMRA